MIRTVFYWVMHQFFQPKKEIGHCGKISYKSKKEAIFWAAIIREKTVTNYKMIPYVCEWCGNWHLSRDFGVKMAALKTKEMLEEYRQEIISLRMQQSELSTLRKTVIFLFELANGKHEKSVENKALRHHLEQKVLPYIKKRLRQEIGDEAYVTFMAESPKQTPAKPVKMVIPSWVGIVVGKVKKSQ